MTRLAGKAAIVTGGAKGIGRHYSQALAAEGARVMIADIADGQELAEEIAGRHGAESVAWVKFDVSDEKAVKNLVAQTIERFGQGDFSARVNSRRSDEFGQLARTVDQMAERIDQLLKSQKRLLQDISHELRSPLARLGVAVELARGGGDATTALNRVEREADRLNTLVGELIQVTRAEGDPDGLATEAVQLDDLVRVILDDVHIEAERRQVTLVPSIAAVEIQGNPELLRRAIENIVRNAIRYSPEQSRVDVSLESYPDSTRVSVRDYGSGVPPEALASIFDPFYRVEKDRGRTSGGVGLGLAIAKRAVELHRGRMSATNVSPGLRVEIEIPAAGHFLSTVTPAGSSNKVSGKLSPMTTLSE